MHKIPAYILWKYKIVIHIQGNVVRHQGTSHNLTTPYICRNDVSEKLTHWGRVTHICVSYLSIIGSDKGLASGRRQAIIWTIAGILLIGPWETNFNEILIKILIFPFKKMRLKVSSAKWWPFCLGLNMLSEGDTVTHPPTDTPGRLMKTTAVVFIRREVRRKARNLINRF